jgi:hypothetical protein
MTKHPSIYGPLPHADNRDRPAAKPDRDGRHVRCPGCKGILSTKTPAACPDCRQPLDREVGK